MLDAEERILRAFDALASPSPSSAPDPGGLRERVEALLRAHDEHRQRGEAYPVTWVGAEIDALRALASAPGAAPEGDDK